METAIAMNTMVITIDTADSTAVNDNPCFLKSSVLNVVLPLVAKIFNVLLLI